MNKKRTFTLAEVLIVIGVIGVVAAITIPTLIPLIKEKVTSNRKEVIEDRLIQGFNQLNTLDDGFNGSQYAQTGTEGFVRALSKHYKMSQICGAENLKDCFPYAEFTYEKDNELKTFKVEDLKSAKNFSLSEDEWYAPAGFISAQGTPFIMLLKKDCIMDTGEGMRGIPTSCVQYMYDNNGSNIPNRLGGSYDIQSSGLVKISGKRPADGTLASAIYSYKTYLILNRDYQGGNGTDNGLNTCDDSEDKKWDDRGSNNPYCSNNRWAAAKKACSEAGYELPTKAQLVQVYNRVNGANGTAKDDTLATKLAEKASVTGCFWSSSTIRNDAYSVLFDRNGYATYGGVDGTSRVLCLGK